MNWTIVNDKTKVQGKVYVNLAKLGTWNESNVKDGYGMI
jgi:hypothetical protein